MARPHGHRQELAATKARVVAQRQAKGKDSEEKRYSLLSALASAERFGRVARADCGIETRDAWSGRLHWVLYGTHPPRLLESRKWTG